MKKEILKETKEPGKSRKKKGQPKGRRNGFLEGLTGKDFTAAGLFFFSLLLCRLFVLQYGVFGSSIDWISQHSTLADYFRKRFYATGNLFPDFAWNLGGGQNIYHFAYYGLLSPTMLLSYLFPFIPMDLCDGFLRAAVCGGCSAFLSMDQQKGSALRQLSFYITFLYVFYRTSISFL